jgi:integrase
MKTILRGNGHDTKKPIIGLRDEFLFTFGINTGFRIGDILNLKWSDLIEENNKVKNRLYIKEEKTEKINERILPESLRKQIKEFYRTSQYPPLDCPVFFSRKGDKPITKVQAHRILSKAGRTIGLKRISCHSLRKTFGYFAYTGGADISRVQKLLNHSSPAVTLAYIGIEQKELDEIVLNLNL